MKAPIMTDMNLSELCNKKNLPKVKIKTKHKTIHILVDNTSTFPSE